MSAANHVTAGRASRLVVCALFASAYQDSGFETALAIGNLDAADQAPAGSTYALRALARRNVAAPQLSGRELGLSYTITERTAGGERSYPAIGNLDALIDAAYDGGALGLTVLVRP